VKVSHAAAETAFVQQFELQADIIAGAGSYQPNEHNLQNIWFEPRGPSHVTASIRQQVEELNAERR
jgi:hypothetical protein